MMIKCLFVTSAYSRAHQVQYAAALAMDPEFGILDRLSSLPPDFMTSNPWMFKAKKGSDPDTPTIREVLTGPYHEEFLEAMSLKISELEAHKTWTVVKRQDVPAIVFWNKGQTRARNEGLGCGTSRTSGNRQ